MKAKFQNAETTYVVVKQMKQILFQGFWYWRSKRVLLLKDELFALHYFAEYRLIAFVSHMGTSSKCGHYVCHIQKEGRWIIFNDEKVALSENPPKDLAYLYVYQRLWIS